MVDDWFPWFFSQLEWREFLLLQLTDAIILHLEPVTFWKPNGDPAAFWKPNGDPATFWKPNEQCVVAIIGQKLSFPTANPVVLAFGGKYLMQGKP